MSGAWRGHSPFFLEMDIQAFVRQGLQLLGRGVELNSPPSPPAAGTVALTGFEQADRSAFRYVCLSVGVGEMLILHSIQ